MDDQTGNDWIEKYLRTLDRFVVYIGILMLLICGYIGLISILKISDSVGSLRDPSDAFAECSEFLMPNGDNIWVEARYVNGEVYCTSIYKGNSYSVPISELKETIENNTEQEAHQ